MTLIELSNQYFRQEAILREKIAAIRAGKTDETTARRIYYLKTEADECRTIGRYLADYYNKEGEYYANKIFTV